MAYTLGRSSSRASEAFDEEFLDFHYHVEPMCKLRGPGIASQAFARIEGPSSGYSSLKGRIWDSWYIFLPKVALFNFNKFQDSKRNMEKC